MPRRLAAAAFGLLAIAAADAGLRGCGPIAEGPPEPDRVGHFGDPRLALVREIFVHGPTLHPRLRPRADANFSLVDADAAHPIRINALGLRMRELDASRPPNAFRALVVGDDHAFGWGVPEEASFPRRLEALLRDRYPSCPIEIVNAGVPGHSTIQMEAYVDELLPAFSPQVVLVCAGFNDAVVSVNREPDVAAWRRYSRADWPWAALRRFLRGSPVYAALFQGLSRMRLAGALGPDPPSTVGRSACRVPTDETEARARSILAKVRGRGLEPVVVAFDLVHGRSTAPLRRAALDSNAPFLEARDALEPAPGRAVVVEDPSPRSANARPEGAIEILVPIRGADGRDPADPIVLAGESVAPDAAPAVLSRLRDDGLEGDEAGLDGIYTARLFARPGDSIDVRVLRESALAEISSVPLRRNRIPIRRLAVPSEPSGGTIRLAVTGEDDDPLAPFRCSSDPAHANERAHEIVALRLVEIVESTRAFVAHRLRCAGS